MNRGISRCGLILCAAAALTGCATTAPSEAPTVPIAAGFRAASPEGPRRPASDDAGWWTGFADPVLDRWIGLALAGNLDLEQAAARMQQARASVSFSRAANLPSGEITAQANATRQSLEGPLGNIISAFPGFNRDIAQFDAGIGASWELDLFGGLARGQKAALSELLASEARRRAAQQMVAAEVADAYVQLRAAQHRLQHFTAREAMDEHQRRLVRMRLGSGIAARRELDLADARLLETRMMLPGLRLAAEIQMNRLAILAGLPPQSDRSDLETITPLPQSFDLALGLPADLLRRRPDVMAAEMQLMAANARVGVALSEYYPKFSIGALLGLQSISLGALAGPDALTATGILGLRWRLFDFKRIDAEIASARSREAEALATYRLAVLKASEDVENAAAGRRETELQLAAAAQNIAALNRFLATQRAAYSAGTIARVEVLEAERQLTAAQDSHIQTSANLSRALIQLARSLGAGIA
jgi:NodT family efflux transporter outer membrane factor (OMF) lipoprotein